MLSHDPKILILAFVGGIIPSLLWLWFWLQEDRQKPEPRSVLTVVFIMGMIGVICVLPIQKFFQAHISSEQLKIIIFAGSEELMKFFAVLAILWHTDYAEEPIDWPIYLITAALGFAALENALFLIKPLSGGENTVGLLTGQLRFLGSTLLHTVASGLLGISLGFAIHKNVLRKEIHVIFGFILAISLHSVFNFFIIKNEGIDFLKVFSFLWVVTIIVMLLFEKVRRMSTNFIN